MIVTIPVVTCPRCHRFSAHPADVEHGYCAHCHDFTDGIVIHVNVKPIKVQHRPTNSRARPS